MNGYDLITLDYDDVGAARLMRRLALFAMFARRVEWRRSASGRGYHVRVYDRRRHCFDELLRMRLFMGDDPARVILDRVRHKAGVLDSVLFTEKAGRVAGPWVEYKS
jgi:hypothetical protein